MRSASAGTFTPRILQIQTMQPNNMTFLHDSTSSLQLQWRRKSRNNSHLPARRWHQLYRHKIHRQDWPAIKPTTQLGGVPVLKVDGDSHCQSVSLARYAGKLGGFYPTDPLQALIVDEAIETLNELMAVAPKHSDPEELLKLRKDFQAGTMTKYVDFLEGLIQKNGGVGFASTPSIADLTLWGTVKMIRTGDWTGIDATFFESFAGIVATVESIAKDDKVVAYYASRE